MVDVYMSRELLKVTQDRGQTVHGTYSTNTKIKDSKIVKK